MDIRNSINNCILCSIALLHVKMKIEKKFLNCCTHCILTHLMRYQLPQNFNHVHKIKVEMNILNSNNYCILCPISLLHVM